MTKAAGPDDITKSAYGALQLLERNLAPGYKLTVEKREAMVITALKQHGEHLAIHNVHQKSIDAFKLVCWFGGSLLELEKNNNANCEHIIDALLKTLRQILVKESDWWLTTSLGCTNLLKSFLLQERAGNGKHGIWMNGLYVAFHCSVANWKDGKAHKIPL